MKAARASLVVLTLAVLASIAPTRADAWATSGNMTVAEIAWRALGEPTRAKVLADLRATKALGVGEGASATTVLALLMQGLGAGEDADRHLFRKASVFPDMARSPLLAKFHHRTWHFINHPIGPAAAKAPRPDDDPTKLAPDHESMNVVRALDWNLAQAVVAQKPEDRGLALCWVLHLVGDIHQPLHCVSWFSDELPDGDKGGNLLFVRRSKDAPANERLHAVWDFLLGTDADGATIGRLADGVTSGAALGFTSEEKTSRDLRAWAIEGRDLALRHAYLDGALRTCRAAPDAPPGAPAAPGCRESGVDAPVLPAGYLDAARAVVDRRIALAGIRLAALLNERIR